MLHWEYFSPTNPRLGNPFISSHLHVNISLAHIPGAVKSFTNMSRQPGDSKNGKPKLGIARGRAGSLSKSRSRANENPGPESSDGAISKWLTSVLAASSVQHASPRTKNGSAEEAYAKSDFCSICCKQFSSMVNLNKHNRTVHKKKYFCTEIDCIATFGQASDLWDHTFRKHNEDF